MELNSMLRNMGLIDAFSTFNQVEIEQSPSECDYSCRNGCSSSCHDGCAGGCATSKSA